MPRRARTFLLLGLGALACTLVLFALLRPSSDDTPTRVAASSSSAFAATSAPLLASATVRTRGREGFVGSAACAPCHQAQAAEYAKSHHAQALLLPSSDSVATKLDGASFSSPLGGTTRFTEKDQKFEVSSPDASGKTETFPIVYVAGVFPLQQYVVATGRGKLQSLGVSRDTRPAADGGARWFHVYGPRGIAHDDPLFFTNAAQNWNHVCADCHSTLVERRYDLEKDGFDTRWAERSVGCEACHGPGAEHVSAANRGDKSSLAAYAKTLVVSLKPSQPWAPSATGSPAPRPPDDTELEVCAPCHSRRQPLREGFLAGDPLLDAFEPELLRAGRYHADGQVEGEVYEWGSFLQSRMHAAGVRCSDCHEPHSAKLYAPGNALCVRCHAPARFDVPSHSHHSGQKAPLCIDCHMPPATFMQIDERRDHSIRIPRPDLSVELGTPNACNGCHTKQTPTWAVEALARWYPGSARRPHFGQALARDRRAALDTPQALITLARDATAPAIARATALERLGHFPRKSALETLRASLANPEPLIVYGAVLGASTLPLEQRAPLLMAVVEHPRLAIRVAVGKALAELPLDQTNPATRAAVERAFAEVEASFAVSASRPETHVERSSFELHRGFPDEAESALKTALRLAPCLAEAHLNYADLARSRADEASAEREIRAALACAPQNAFAHHALGLWFVRAKKTHEALPSLRKAVELAPLEARFSYVLAVASAQEGDLTEAVRILDGALLKNPNDRDLLQVLAGYLRRRGQQERASDVEAKLAALLRD
ncbi:MAG: tetratricopeptide repeat protein [Pseudomonadota bacterium]